MHRSHQRAEFHSSPQRRSLVALTEEQNEAKAGLHNSSWVAQLVSVGDGIFATLLLGMLCMVSFKLNCLDLSPSPSSVFLGVLHWGLTEMVGGSLLAVESAPVAGALLIISVTIIFSASRLL